MELTLEIFRSVQAGDPFAFRAGAQEYVLRTPLGGAETLTLVWDEELISELTLLRRPGRDPVLVQRIGERLRRFLNTTSFAQREAEILRAVQDSEPVRITFRLAAAELYSLPWELLALAPTGIQLGALPTVLLRYAWPETETAVLDEGDPAQRNEAGRLLFAWSAAGGAVPAASHLSALQRAFDAGQLAFDPERDVVPHVTPARLALALRSPARRATVVLHILCHGVRKDKSFGLSWDSGAASESQDTGPQIVDAGQLRQLLMPFAAQLRVVVLLACDGGNSGALGNQLGSVAQALHRAGIAAVVASRYPLSTAGSVRFTEVLYDSLLGGPRSLEESFLLARQRLLHDSQGLDWAALQLYARPEDGEDTRPFLLRPYRGLEPFLVRHSRFFFGRHRERTEARYKLDALRQGGKPRFLIVTGASGTGKSSVVLGGLIPDLLGQTTGDDRNEQIRLAAAELVRLLGEQPRTPTLQAAIATIREELSTLQSGQGAGAWQFTVLRPGKEPLSALHRALSEPRDRDRPLLLCVDQLEELFTHENPDDGVADEVVRQDFVKRLWALSREPNQIHCVLTLRVDFLGRCGELVLDENGLRLDRVAYANEHHVFVAQPEADQLVTAIVEPARRVGLSIAPALAQRMMSEVAGEPGALPLLSYVLDLLWQRREGRELSERCYAELGGVAGALERSADRIFLTLSEADRLVARQILVRLVSFSEGGAETRRRTPLSELREQVADPQKRLDAVLAAFVDARLLVRSEDAGQTVIEVAHEFLIRKWERLRGFLREDRQLLDQLRELKQWAVQYAQYGTLLGGAQLGYAQQLLRKHPSELGSQVTAMINASTRAQRQRRLRISAAITFVLLALGSLSVKLRTSEQQARNEQRIAEQKEIISQARLLGMHTERSIATEPDAALVYAAQAVGMYTEHSTQHALFTALLGSQSIHRFFHALPGPIRAIAISPDSRTVVAAGGEKGLFLFDVKRGALRKQLTPPITPEKRQEEFHSVAISPDGRTLAAGGSSGRLWLWSLSMLDQPAHALQISTGGLHCMEYSPDGARLAIGTKDGQVYLLDTAKQQVSAAPLQTLAARDVTAISFEPKNGRYLAVVESSGTFSVFAVATGERKLSEAEAGRGYLTSVAWSPTEHILAMAGEDHEVLLFDSKSGQRLELAKAGTRHAATITAVSFSPDGRFLTSCGLDRQLVVWDMQQRRVIDPVLLAPMGPLNSCAMSSDGRLLASGGDGLALLFDLTTHPAIHRAKNPAEVSAIAVEPEGRRALIGAPDGTLRPWDLAVAQPGLAVSVHKSAVNALSYSPDGKHVYAGFADGSVGMYSARTLEREQTFLEPGHRGAMAVAQRPGTAPGSELIAVGYADGSLGFFAVGSGQRSRPVVASRQQSVSALTWLGDGSALVSGGLDGTLRVFTSDGEPVGCPQEAVPVHAESVNSGVTSLLYSTAGQCVVSGGVDKSVRLWRPRTDDKAGPRGCLMQAGDPLGWHPNQISAMSVTLDGRLLAVGGEDTAGGAGAAVVLFDILAREALGVPIVVRGQAAVTALGFAKGPVLLRGDADTIWRFDLDTGRALGTACARAGRNLSLAEWRRTLGSRPYCRTCPDFASGAGAPADAPPCTSPIP